MKIFNLSASSDELQLSVMLTEPEGQASGIVQLVHGMCEHKERYIPFMEYLSSKGYICIIHDHRGHGASVKNPDDLGYMYEGGWRAMVEDIRVVCEWVRKEYPGLSLTLFGHSMGSMAVRSFAKRYDSMIDRLIVCGSPSDNPAKGAGKMLAGIIGFLRGERFRPQVLQNLSFGAYNKPFSHEPYHSAWVCSDREVLEAYHKDPLCQYIFTANGFKNLLGLMADCYSRKGWAMGSSSLPVHFISGSEDPCMISREAFDSSVKLMKDLGYGNTTFKIYEGMRHEILNESGKQTVWDDILKILA